MTTNNEQDDKTKREKEDKTEASSNVDAYTLDSAALGKASRESRGRYQPLQPNAYREPLLKELENALHAVIMGDLSQTKMARFNHRSQEWELRFGIGKRCVRLETEDTSAQEDLVFYNTKDLLAALQELHKRTKRGDYDAALNKKLKQRQEHAYAMLSKRKSEGFQNPKAKIRKLAAGIAMQVASQDNEGWNDLKDLDRSAPTNTVAGNKQSDAAE